MRVPHLASHVLGLSVRQIAEDWEWRYGRRPVLVETLVDERRFPGTCYRAANWQDVGLTAGRGRMDRANRRHGVAPKRVFVYPLVADATAQLRQTAGGVSGVPVSGSVPPVPQAAPERGPRPRVMALTAEDQAELERRVRAATSTQRAAIRARIILCCAEGERADQVARRLGISPRRVERWRARFVRQGLAGLEDRPRPGPRRRFETVTRMELIALACEPLTPPAGRTRTIEALCTQAVERGIVARISWSSMQRILSEGDVRPHHVRGWVHSPDPQFREKVTELTELYLNPPPDSVVLSIDEKTSMQALERRFPDRPPAPGQAARREFEYIRHGTQSLLSAFAVHRGTVTAACGERRGANDLLAFMEGIAAQYPTGTVHVIWDNLNIHYDGKDERWTKFNEQHGQRFVFHYTPKHASWVHQVELFFSILERQCLKGASFGSTAELRAAVLGFIERWNRVARPFRWTFRGYPLQSGIDSAALRKVA